MELITVKGIKDPICSRADFNAEIVPGKRILIYGQSGRRLTDKAGEFSRRFDVGDRAEYHSYNLRYTGIITSIGAKTVTIKDQTETRRLSLLDFCCHNWDFDAAKIDAYNEAERVCL